MAVNLFVNIADMSINASVGNQCNLYNSLGIIGGGEEFVLTDNALPKNGLIDNIKNIFSKSTCSIDFTKNFSELKNVFINPMPLSSGSLWNSSLKWLNNNDLQIDFKSPVHISLEYVNNETRLVKFEDCNDFSLTLKNVLFYIAKVGNLTNHTMELLDCVNELACSNPNFVKCNLLPPVYSLNGYDGYKTPLDFTVVNVDSEINSLGDFKQSSYSSSRVIALVALGALGIFLAGAFLREPVKDCETKDPQVKKI